MFLKQYSMHGCLNYIFIAPNTNYITLHINMNVSFTITQIYVHIDENL